jgi:hypothetical protein
MTWFLEWLLAVWELVVPVPDSFGLRWLEELRLLANKSAEGNPNAMMVKSKIVSRRILISLRVEGMVCQHRVEWLLQVTTRQF